MQFFFIVKTLTFDGMEIYASWLLKNVAFKFGFN